MNKLLLLSGSVTLLLCGCTGTRVATGNYSEEEEAWIRTLKQSYPDYRAPRTVTPAYSNATLERTSAKISKPLASADDPKAEAQLIEEEEVEEETDAGEMTAKDAVAPAPADQPEAKQPAADAAKPAADAAKPAADAAKPAADAAKPAADAAKPAADAAKPAADAAKPAAQAEPLEPTSSTVYEVKSGDTLGKISLKAYGTVRHADLIFRANSDLLKNPNMLKPGMKLLIPKL